MSPSRGGSPNRGRTLVFRGAGKHWDDRVILRYYQYFWEDSGGRWHYESWQSERPLLKYKGRDPGEVGEIRYTCSSPSGSMSGRTEPDRNGYAIIGAGSSNGALNDEKDLYTVTVEWNGHRETFTLRAVP